MPHEHAVIQRRFAYPHPVSGSQAGLHPDTALAPLRSADVN
jgi:hypothetical protein